MTRYNVTSLCFRCKSRLEVGFSKVADIDNAKSNTRCTSFHGTVTELFYEVKAF